MGYPVYRGEVEALEGKRPFGDGECVALVQHLTSVGPTMRWRPGPRVVDLGFLNPGAVIANFAFDNKGAGRFPNRHGYHAALFVEFGPRSMTTGKPVRLGSWTSGGEGKTTSCASAASNREAITALRKAIRTTTRRMPINTMW